MDEILNQIEVNTRPKASFQIMVSSDTSRFVQYFRPTIELEKDRQYEIGLVNLETYYSFPNIDASNNKFVYSVSGTS